jgi:hypothetical protein
VYKTTQNQSKSIIRPGLPVNGKCGHSAPDFVHVPRCHATAVTDTDTVSLLLFFQSKGNRLKKGELIFENRFAYTHRKKYACYERSQKALDLDVFFE